MAARRTLELTVRAEPGERADKALARALEESGRHCSRRDARRLIEQAKLRVDGRRIDRSSAPLAAGDRRLELNAPADLIPAADVRERVALDDDAILSLADDLVVLNKPSGIPTDPTRDPRRDNVIAALGRYLAERGERDDGLRAVHRLDRDTSGVLLVARTRRAAAELGAAFRERESRKTYLAAVVFAADGPDWALRGGEEPAAAGRDGWTAGVTRTVDAPIGRLERSQRRPKDSRGRTVGTSYGVTRTGKEARTALTCLAANDEAALVEARPETGRTHQVRIHLRHVGLPIAGDRAYGALGPEAPRVLLHAARLQIGDQAWTAPLPDDFRAWLDAHGLADDGLADEDPTGT